MRFLIILFCLMAGSQAVSLFETIAEEWTAFKLTYSKKYKSEIEERYRMKIFMDNKYKITKHNLLYDLRKVTFKLKMNKYGDLLLHETINMENFKQYEHRTNLLDKYQKLMGSTFISLANIKIPESIDWRSKGAVTPVKDQGYCGSSWAFSATGSIEGQHFRKTGKLVSLSEQNLMDCVTSYKGCNDSMTIESFCYVIQNGGIDTEDTYPFVSLNQNCKYNPENSGATVSGFVHIPGGNEDKLQETLASVGPVSIVIDASQESFVFYHEGIYYDSKCNSKILDHHALAVGYGTENGTDYYIVKNSWGKSWGMDGYIKMARNKDNNCGIASNTAYPLV